MSDITTAKNLRAAGFTQEQADILAESISNGITTRAASKLDVAKIDAKINIVIGVLLVVLGVVLALLFRSVL